MPDLSTLPIQPAPAASAAGAEVAPVVSEAGAADGKQYTDQHVFNLPPEVKKLPLIKAISVGQPPAVRVGPGEYYPELRPLVTKLPQIIEGGLDVYPAATKDIVL